MSSSSRFRTIIAFSILAVFIIVFALLGQMSLKTHAAGTSEKLSVKSRAVTRALMMNCGAWQTVPSPNPGSSSIDLSGVAAIAANDVWAVGDYETSSSYQTLIEQWNGTNWSIIPSQNPGQQNYLSGIAAVSANDIWTVGYYVATDGTDQMLSEHWDGTSWTIVPNLGIGYLTAVAVVSANDVWAVGTQIEHWDGASWTSVPSPSLGLETDLYGVTSISASNIWVVGRYETLSFSYQTFTEHWDGTQWSIIPSPNGGTGSNELFGVAQVPGTDHVWAVGSHGNGFKYALIEHWNGKKWSIYPSQNIGNLRNYLMAVTVLSKNNVWAVGSYENKHSNGQVETLIEHWDGTSWAIVPSPSPGGFNFLHGVAGVPNTTQVWTVGFSGVIEFYC